MIGADGSPFTLFTTACLLPFPRYTTFAMASQSLFKQISTLSGGDAYLFLDDLYHIRRSDQAKVIDYFHRIAKGNNLWLKIGTIRHRTQ
jgi:hypothetical protein